MSTDGEKDIWAFIVELTLKIYERHVHAGKAFVDFDYCLHGAAVIVGAAQSPVLHELIEQAKASPAKALKRLQQSERLFAEKADEGRRQQVSDLVSALRAEG